MRRRFVLTSLAAIALQAHKAQARAGDEPLPPQEAFRVRPVAKTRDWLALEFRSAPGYFLYAHRFEFLADRSDVQIAEVRLPAGGQQRFDAALGRNVTCFPGDVLVRLRVDGNGAPFRLTARAQGCSETGLCYPVIERRFDVSAERR